MAEAEQAHRHRADLAALQADNRAITRGQWLGALVSLASIAGAIATALAGVYWAVPVALVSVPVASIVRALVGRNQ